MKSKIDSSINQMERLSKSDPHSEGKNLREQGVALLEFTFVGPMMVLMLFITVDFTMYLQSYFRATHILREGLRLAAVTPSLEVGLTNNDNIAAISNQGHASIHRRVRMLLDAEDYDTTNPGEYEKLGLRMKADSIAYEQNLAVSVNRIGLVDGRVEITLQGTYNPLLNFGIGSFPLKYTVKGSTPYLLH